MINPIFRNMTEEQILTKCGYEIVEVYPDDESTPVKYQWETYWRSGNEFDTYDEAVAEAIEDCNELED